MTAQPIELVDLAAMVGEMPAVPCESEQHGIHPVHTDEPASHYVQAVCPTCNSRPHTFAACPGFVAAVRANVIGRCPNCKAQHPALDMATILGPVAR